MDVRGRVLAITAALLLCASAYASAAYVIDTDQVTALVEADGATILEAADSDEAFPIGGSGCFAVGERGGYALFSPDGERIGGEVYEMLSEIEGVIVYRQDGLCGAMTAGGEPLVAPVWTQLVPTGEDSFAAMAGSPYDERADEILIVAPGGEPEPTGIRAVDGLRPFSGGRMAYLAAGGRYGWIDARGRATGPAAWRYAGDYVDGAAVVCDESGYGMVDADGAAVIPTGYARMMRTARLTAAVSTDGSIDVYTSDGSSLLFSVEAAGGQAEVVGSCVAVTTQDGAKLYDRTGRCIVEASGMATFQEGFDGQVIASDGDWGAACQRLIDPDGTTVSSSYQRILPLCPGRYAFIELPGTAYNSEELGDVATSWDYTGARYGLLDGRGRVVLPAQFREIRAAGADRLLIRDEDGWAFADLDGRPLRRWPTGGGE